MNKNTKKIITIVIGLFVLTGVLVWGFYQVTQNKGIMNSTSPNDEIAKLIEKDIEGNYPGTPREVLKLYFRITQCMYNEEMTEKEFDALASQLRLLFDDELLENNKENTFRSNLNADIKEFKENGERITGYEVELGSETKRSKINGKDYATLKATAIVQKRGKQNNFYKTREIFLFRQDENEQWKIAHWKLSTAKDEED